MIATKRLLIRPWTPDGAESFFQLSQDAGFTLFPITKYQQLTLQNAQDWIHQAIELNQQTGLGKWAVWEKASGQLVGMGGLTPWQLEDEKLVDITYRLRQSAWGQGLGTELAMALVTYGFKERGLPQITATITPDNISSKNIAEKLGMNYDRQIILLGVATDLYRLWPAAQGSEL
jgi:[ribosomal protein S5]-alanine N-acetyltransferase